MLYEIYRAEQYAFDGTGLAVAGNNYNANKAATNIVQSGLNQLGSAGTALGGLLGIDRAEENLIPKNMPTLAQYAFTVEMYYSGVIYRGYFTSMNIIESADNFNFQYDMSFVATQKRGYRTNTFGWQKSPNIANAYDMHGELEGFKNSFNGKMK